MPGVSENAFLHWGDGLGVQQQKAVVWHRADFSTLCPAT